MRTTCEEQPGGRVCFEEMVNLSKVLNQIFIGALVAVGLISVNSIREWWGTPNTYSVVILFLVTAGLYGIYKTGYSRVAGIGLLIAISIVVTYNLFIAGGINDNVVIVFPVLIIIAGLVLGKKSIPCLTGLFLLEVSGIYWLTVTGRIHPFRGAVTVTVQNFLTVFILLLIYGVVIWIAEDALERNFLKIIDTENRLKSTYDQTIRVWGKALELFDQETEGHSLRVVDLTLALAREIGVDESELEHIHRGILLHDIGKMGIGEAVLNKTESLSSEERIQIEKHPLNAQKMLKDIPFLEKAMAVPVYHHERWDGTGYPFQLAGEEIPLAARIFAIVDNWDALRSDRPYRKAWPKDQVIEYIKNQSGMKFDPDLVDAFLSIVD